MRYVIATIMIAGGLWNWWFAFTLNRPGNFQAGGMLFVACWFMLATLRDHDEITGAQKPHRRWGLCKCPHEGCNTRRLSRRSMREHLDECHPRKFGGMSFYFPEQPK